MVDDLGHYPVIKAWYIMLRQPLPMTSSEALSLVRELSAEKPTVETWIKFLEITVPEQDALAVNNYTVEAVSRQAVEWRHLFANLKNQYPNGFELATPFDFRMWCAIAPYEFIPIFPSVRSISLRYDNRVRISKMTVSVSDWLWCPSAPATWEGWLTANNIGTSNKYKLSSVLRGPLSADAHDQIPALVGGSLAAARAYLGKIGDSKVSSLDVNEVSNQYLNGWSKALFEMLRIYDLDHRIVRSTSRLLAKEILRLHGVI